MTLRTILVHFIIFATAAVLLSCGESGPPDIKIKWPKLVMSTAEKGVASAFMVILNDGKGSDSLVGCAIKEYPYVRGELHDYISGRMQIVKEIKIPPGDAVEFKAGGVHLMFFGMPEQVPNELTVVLRFAKSGTMETRSKILWY